MSHPNAAELLVTARDLLLKQLLPALPERLHYECRMIARAMAIACREIDLASMAEREEEKRLADLLGVHAFAGLSHEDGRALLSQLIRQGIYDPPGKSRNELLQALDEINRTRLLISNPKVVSDER
jgi:hypothetical protein